MFSDHKPLPKSSKLSQKTRLPRPEGQVVDYPLADPLFLDSEALQMMTAGSITNRIAFGLHAGKKVRKIGSGFGYEEEIPILKGKGCYSIHGFSCHANTKINTQSRDILIKLFQYISRGPLSNERLSMTPKDEVKLWLKTKWSDGTSHLLFTSSEFLEKLWALIPLPKSHLVRWAGVFAPNSPLRKKIDLKSDVKKGDVPRDFCTSLK